jgi:hypothetical protein
MKKDSKTLVLQRDKLITVDEAVSRRHDGKVYFQHKIDRLLTMLEGKFPAATAKK